MMTLRRNHHGVCTCTNCCVYFVYTHLFHTDCCKEFLQLWISMQDDSFFCSLNVSCWIVFTHCGGMWKSHKNVAPDRIWSLNLQIRSNACFLMLRSCQDVCILTDLILREWIVIIVLKSNSEVQYTQIYYICNLDRSMFPFVLTILI